jgi:cupin 2 domain-containing protein
MGEGANDDDIHSFLNLDGQGVPVMFSKAVSVKGIMVNNLLSSLPQEVPVEVFETILENTHFRLERILSAGQVTPPGAWYEQDDHEWVLLLSGGASLRFEDDPNLVKLHPGDSLLILAHRRHRVEWTDPVKHTVWLALHYSEETKPL